MRSKADIPTPEERAARHLEADRLATRDERWSAFRTLVECWVWCAIGVGILALGMHTDDEKLGRIYFWGGIVVGNSGMLWTLIRHYQRGDARGDGER